MEETGLSGRSPGSTRQGHGEHGSRGCPREQPARSWVSWQDCQVDLRGNMLILCNFEQLQRAKSHWSYGTVSKNFPQSPYPQEVGPGSRKRETSVSSPPLGGSTTWSRRARAGLEEVQSWPGWVEGSPGGSFYQLLCLSAKLKENSPSRLNLKGMHLKAAWEAKELVVM